ncbi:hypothetical protein [Paracoccus sp. NSM]|uniref:hypothetical protein n=1 Tax=Paracoccus sp. NSM TaxID=3457784 RepID=UPI0040368237
MFIERILRDPDGTKVRLGAIEYRFRPIWNDGPHVARVEDEAHQSVLLAIREGYREYSGPMPDVETAAAAISAIITPPAAPAPAPVVTPEPEPAQGDQTGAASEPAQDGEGQAPATDFDALDDDALRALFKDEIGRAPNSRAGRDTMIAQIEAKRAEAATEQKDA